MLLEGLSIKRRRRRRGRRANPVVPPNAWTPECPNV
jgi:hypothetical protein